MCTSVLSHHFNGYKNLVILLAGLFISTGLLAQQPAANKAAASASAAAPAAAPAATPAISATATPSATSTAPAAPAPNYEALLDQYYKFFFGKSYVKAVLRSYRKKNNKADAKYNFIESAEYEVEAEKLFKENWKAAARAKFSIQELQYILVLLQSTVQKKMAELDGETVSPEVITKLFDPLTDKMSRSGK